MKITCILFILFLGFCSAPVSHGAQIEILAKKRILVVSSYHREYHWSQETNEGFCAAMLKYGYFDNKEQAAEYTKNDLVETSKVIVKKLWLDAKRKGGKAERETMSLRIYTFAKDFKPELIFLGDDEAAEYLGKKYLDSKVPVVLWGVNNTPVKYGLVDTTERPGHNVTGVYQSGYYRESLQLLKAIAPRVKTFAVLSDTTSTGRSHYKAIEYLHQQGALPLALVETIATDSFEVWQDKALELRKKVDAFFVVQYSGLKDRSGNYVPPEDAAKWYTDHISIPEAVEFRGFVAQGMLCGANDSGYNQSFEAVMIAHDILNKGADPAMYPARAPKRGALMVNIKRAKALGITLTPGMGIEEFVGGEAR